MDLDTAFEYIYPLVTGSQHKELDRIKDRTKKDPEAALSDSLFVVMQDKFWLSNTEARESLLIGFIWGIRSAAASHTPMARATAKTIHTSRVSGLEKDETDFFKNFHKNLEEEEKRATDNITKIH